MDPAGLKTVPPALAGDQQGAGKREGRLALLRNTAVILGICALSMFFDIFGYLLAAAGLYLLWKHGKLDLKTRLFVTALVLLPKAAIYLLNRGGSPDGIFRLEPVTFETSSSVWAWSLLFLGGGIGCLKAAAAIRREGIEALRRGLGKFSPSASGIQGKKGAATATFAVMGAICVVASALIFSGFEDDFQAIEPGDGGRWRLTHLVRGTVASFAPHEVEAITGERDSGDKADLSLYKIRIGLRGGESWSMNTRSSGAEEMLKTLAATMDLPPGTMILRMAPGRQWSNTGSKVRLEDWVGSYRSVAGKADLPPTVLEFRIEDGRLAGSETVRLGDKEVSRQMRNIRITPVGEIEFETETLSSAEKKDGDSYRFSLNLAPHRRAALREGFIEVDGTRFERTDRPTEARTP